MIIDTHIHLSHFSYNGEFPYLYKVVGKDGKGLVLKLFWKQRKQLNSLSDHPSVVAIGETGLDYHLARREQHRFWQKMWFLYQLKLAHMKKLPVILHIRDADADAIRILNRYKQSIHGGVCHCFSGSAENAKRYINLGLMLGIGGSLLIDSPKKQALEQAVVSTPIENIVLETDGPYVKPECPDIQKKQTRKARNTSLIIPVVARRIAELKHLPVEEVLQVTSENAIRLFGLNSRDCTNTAQ